MFTWMGLGAINEWSIARGSERQSELIGYVARTRHDCGDDSVSHEYELCWRADGRMTSAIEAPVEALSDRLGGGSTTAATGAKEDTVV